jgi:hypothetical protein
MRRNTYGAELKNQARARIQEYHTFLALALALTVTSVAALAGKRLHRFENQR